ncbi:MAG: lysozyme inhibitor [Candidatus Yonathbacteria bacterium]|nr:lysozyme inhibitor [Candidatus Yonathbacteria bacterium]NTW47819.1 lysozyme inhibitor [Candidatus Yonathbacteria bacterium]
MERKNIIIVSIITLVVVSGTIFYFDSLIPSVDTETPIANVTATYFYCTEGIVAVTFGDTTADVIFPDQRVLTMTQGVSGSGARYENGDVVFWNKGDGAFVTENDEMIYSNCITATVTPEGGDMRHVVDASQMFEFSYPAPAILSGGELGYTETWRQQTTTLGMVLAKVSIPRTFEPDTNFSEAILTIGTSADPDAVKTCVTDAGGAQVEKSQMTIGSTPFTVLSYSDAGAGNYYDTTSYRTVRDGQCYAIEYTIHTTNIDNYPRESGITVFDRNKITAVLEGIVRSFIFLPDDKKLN